MKYQNQKGNTRLIMVAAILVIMVVAGFVLVYGPMPESTPEEIRAIQADKLESIKRYYLPDRAQITQDLGNGWYEIVLDGKRFLFRSPVDRRHAPSITQIR